MEAFVNFFNSLDQRTVVLGVSVVLLWIFLKAIRGIIQLMVFFSVVAITVIEFPALKNFFISLIS